MSFLLVQNPDNNENSFIRVKIPRKTKNVNIVVNRFASLVLSIHKKGL